MDDQITELNKKNAETFNIVVKQQNKKIEDQQKTIDIMNNTISGLSQRLNEIEQQLLLQKANSFGNGPSKM